MSAAVDPSLELTDTHCHLDMQRFDADRESVIERATLAGVSRMLVPSVDLESARRVLNLAGGHGAIYAAIGVHPTEVDDLNEFPRENLEQLAAGEKVVAIGEIGLDYYWISEPGRRLKQQTALRMQLEIAEAASLPVVLHMREQDDADKGACADDMLRLLGDWVRGLRSHHSDLADRPGVLHSFSGTPETAAAAMELGFYIGITGPVTYPSAEKRRAVVRGLPIERLLIETDAPFLAPQPRRGQRNEPAFVAIIADRIAEIQSRTLGEVANATNRNAASLFAWGDPD